MKRKKVRKQSKSDSRMGGNDMAFQTQELRINHRFVELLLENIPDMIFVKDANDLRFVRFNKAGEELLGFSRDELLGKCDYDFFPKEEADFFTTRDRETLARGEKVEIPEEPIQTKHHGIRWLHTKKIPILDEQGNPEYLLGMSADITDRKKVEDALRESENRYRTIFDTTGTTMLIVEEDMTISLANHGFESLTGYTREEVEGKRKWTEFVEKGDLDKMVRQHLLRREDSGLATKSYEFRLVHRDGRLKNILLTVDLIPGTKRSVASLMDITDRKRAEEALRESEEKYRFIAENTVDVISIVDMNLRFTYVSPSVFRTRRFIAKEAVNQTLDQVLTPESMRYALSVFAEEMELEATGNADPQRIRILELEEYRKDGSLVWVEVTMSYLRDRSGKPIGILQVSRDITERKQAEEALRESQRRLADIIEFLPDATLVIDKKGNVISWNHAIAEMTGITSADMLGRGNFEYALPFYNERRPLLVDRVLESHTHTNREGAFVQRGENFLLEEGWVPQIKGEARFLSRRAAAIYSINGEVVGAIESIRDITEQKLIEKAFAAEHEKLSSILDGSPVSTFVIDRDCWVTEWNLANEYFTGMSKSSVIGKPINLQPLFQEKAPPTLAELVLEMPDEEIITRYANKGVRKSVIHPQAFETVGSIWIDGKEHMMAVQATRLRDPEGNVIGAIQCAQDITEQKRFEAALRESEERYRTILENIEDGYFEVDIAGNLTFFNDAFCRLHRYSPTEMMGMNYRQYTDKENSQKLYQVFNKVFTTGESLKGADYEIIGKDGTKRFVEATASLISSITGQPMGFRGVLRDITERKRTEKARYHHEKIQGVLEMAGAICHEMNQPMQIISGYAEMLLKDISVNDPIHKKLDAIHNQIQRMGAITKKLMTIHDYKTQEYAGLGRIIDINKSSENDTG